MLKGIKKLFGPLLFSPLLFGLDCVSAVLEAMELQVEACCDGAASRNQELFGPLLADLDCMRQCR